MRHHCEFINCTCAKFIKQRNNICLCKHANIWHATKSRNHDTTFDSTRPPARTPVYKTRNRKVSVFLPIVPPLPEPDIIYCEAVEVLPV
jgi:hypothetical protein